MSFDLTDYNPLYGLIHWLIVVGAVAGIVVLVSMATAAFGGGQLGLLRAIGSKITGKRSEPLPWGDVKRAFIEVFRGIFGAIVEFFRMSPRRVGAVAKLTFKEATRRKALLVGVIFALLIMFGGWFLADSGQRADLQVKVHVSFVLTAISWLILPVALLLSCWGLPEDIKRRSLHTVVTKPVRRSEIILGRMLGYSFIGTVVLAVMGVVGYVWIIRMVPPRAKSQLTCRVPVYGNIHFLDREGNPGTGVNVGDIWEFRQYVEGATRARAIWDFKDITPAALVTKRDRESGELIKRLVLETRFEAFRTHKGTMGEEVNCELFFTRPTRENAARALASCPGLGRLGEIFDSGDFRGAAIVLGEANPRSTEYDQFAAGCRDFVTVVSPALSNQSASEAGTAFVQAATQCAEAAESGDAAQLSKAIKDFAGLLDKHADELSQKIIDLRVAMPAFPVREFSLNVLEVDPYAIKATETNENGEEVKRTLNLFEDIAVDDSLRIEVSCVDAGQFLGVARPDLFIRTPDRPFWVGFSKSIAGIWLMMELIVILGVTAGSLLNGPVSTFLVFGTMVVGQWFREFLQSIIAGQSTGGGVFESVIRIYKHMNQTSKLEEGTLTTIVKFVDQLITGMLWLAAQIIPDFRSFGRVLEFLPNGFDVSWSKALLPSLSITVGYFIPCILVGYFCLKLRELEQK